MNTQITRQLHEKLDCVLILISEKQISKGHEQRHHELVTQAGRTTVSKDCVPEHQSLSEWELSSKQKSEPANAVYLGEYLKLLQPGVEGGVMPLEQHVLDVVEAGHQGVT